MSISEPSLGSVSSSQVGDVMLRQGKYKEHDAVYLKNETDVGWAYTLFSGYYLKHGDDEIGEYYQPGGGDDGGRVQKAAIADPWKSVLEKREGPFYALLRSLMPLFVVMRVALSVKKNLYLPKTLFSKPLYTEKSAIK